MSEPWHRRHAVQLAAQLPDDPADALLVLSLTINLVSDFLHPEAEKPKGTAKLIQLASVHGVCKT